MTSILVSYNGEAIKNFKTECVPGKGDELMDKDYGVFKIDNVRWRVVEFEEDGIIKTETQAILFVSIF